MDEQAQEGVSVISEISGYQSGSAGMHFAAALGWGTAAGTLALIISIALAAVSGPPSIGAAASMLLAFHVFGIVVGLFTLAGMIAIGLPITLFLYLTRCENQVLYAAIGGFAGFVMMLAIFNQGSRIEFAEFAFGAAGGLAGGASGWRWGGWREALAIAREQNPIPNPQPED